MEFPGGGHFDVNVLILFKRKNVRKAPHGKMNDLCSSFCAACVSQLSRSVAVDGEISRAVL